MEKIKCVDYRSFSLKKINTTEFKHLKYLIFWPVFGVFFLCVERIWVRESYFSVHCALDDRIPFCEYFLIPYLFWFVFLVGIQIYTLLYDVESFKRFIKFTAISFGLTILIYILFPNCQELRPVTYGRENIFTRFMTWFYQFDTNTNVCPSLHVIGSVAVLFGAWKSRHFSTFFWRILFTTATILISISTVFLKQHSVLDILAAIPVCLLSYLAVSVQNKKSNEKTGKK